MLDLIYSFFMKEAKQFGIEFGACRPELLQIIETPGNNTIAVAEYGPKNGKPVLLIPGTHGSRTGPLIVNESTLHQLNIRLFSIDPYGWGIPQDVRIMQLQI